MVVCGLAKQLFVLVAFKALFVALTMLANKGTEQRMVSYGWNLASMFLYRCPSTTVGRLEPVHTQADPYK